MHFGLIKIILISLRFIHFFYKLLQSPKRLLIGVTDETWFNEDKEGTSKFHSHNRMSLVVEEYTTAQGIMQNI